MKRAYKYRFYPTNEQSELLAKSFGCARFVYNNTLRYRTDAYYKDGMKIGNKETSARLLTLKKEFPFLKDVSNVVLQQVLRNQERAYINFWAGRAQYPTFKSKHHKQSIQLTKSAFRFKDGDLFIAKSDEPLNIRFSREFSSEPSSLTISKDCAGRYFVSMLCEFEPEKLTVTPNTVGVDLGLTHLVITDKGDKFNNPRHTKRYEKKLAKMQRRLSKKKLGSANRAKAKLKVARVHAKISDARQDNLHKLSRKLINENQVVCMESLKVKNMVKNPTLSKAISDAGWGELSRQIAYKAEWAGRTLVKIDQWFPSSKRCSGCGFTMKKLSLNIRSWTCPECYQEHCRDQNAAINIRTVGLTGLAFGENVSAG